MTQKFGCADDKLTAGKPCENCNCGKKELQEGTITSIAAPTMNGYPVVFVGDWCGDHKLNEEAV